MEGAPGRDDCRQALDMDHPKTRGSAANDRTCALPCGYCHWKISCAAFGLRGPEEALKKKKKTCEPGWRKGREDSAPTSGHRRTRVQTQFFFVFFFLLSFFFVFFRLPPRRTLLLPGGRVAGDFHILFTRWCADRI